VPNCRRGHGVWRKGGVVCCIGRVGSDSNCCRGSMHLGSYTSLATGEAEAEVEAEAEAGALSLMRVGYDSCRACWCSPYW
jgi:hypothetical protein